MKVTVRVATNPPNGRHRAALGDILPGPSHGKDVGDLFKKDTG